MRVMRLWFRGLGCEGRADGDEKLVYVMWMDGLGESWMMDVWCSVVLLMG